MITPKEAKELTLEVWRYLRDHHEIRKKKDLPKSIFCKISLLQCECPLCAMFIDDCDKCPLAYCMLKNQVYYNWVNASNNEERQQAATRIVELVEAWEV